MMTQSLLQKYWPYFSPAAILAILLAAGAYIVASLPPRTIVMATDWPQYTVSRENSDSEAKRELQ